MLHISDFFWAEAFWSPDFCSKSIDQLEWAFYPSRRLTSFWRLWVSATAASVDWALNYRSESLSTPTTRIAECPVRLKFGALYLICPDIFSSILLILVLFLFYSIIFLSHCIHLSVLSLLSSGQAGRKTWVCHTLNMMCENNKLPSFTVRGSCRLIHPWNTPWLPSSISHMWMTNPFSQLVMQEGCCWETRAGRWGPWKALQMWGVRWRPCWPQLFPALPWPVV